ncbi:hypothetical protein F511_33659 [Dorcoceras hygrometricum]|uniref:Uncharacterized protein n=1 Tax=Dorcoceras hygrometricum TaxID=472368 RepID=A0A2Z7DC01_9LAMI|nr:hypothetical protein F511_33659 [Dorcoceras hygrometricum]
MPQGVYGQDKRPELTNLDKEANHRGLGFLLKHRVHLEELNEHQQEKLLEEPRQGLMKVLRISTVGNAEQGRYISTNCPENEKKGIKRFEPTPDI